MGRMKADEGYEYLRRMLRIYDHGGGFTFCGEDYLEAARAVCSENTYLRTRIKMKRPKPDYEKDMEYFNKLAKGLVCQIFRNSILEDYHSEGVPIDDERMKALMKDCVNRAFPVIAALLSENSADKDLVEQGLLSTYDRYCKSWDDAESSYMQFWIPDDELDRKMRGK